MVKCECIEKFRDKQGNIKGYRLRDNQGQCLDVKSDQLKMAIFSKQIEVLNLKLTTDGKLIDKEIDVITKLRKIDELNRTEEKTADRLNKYRKIIEKSYNNILDLAKKFSIKKYETPNCFDFISFRSLPIGIIEIDTWHKLLYTENTSIILGDKTNIKYDVELLMNSKSQKISLIISVISNKTAKEDYHKKPISSYLELITTRGYDVIQGQYFTKFDDFTTFYTTGRYYDSTCKILTGDSNIDNDEEISTLLNRIIIAEVLDNYEEVTELVNKEIEERYNKLFLK